MKPVKSIIIGILTWQAKQIVRKYKPFIVAVTGSVGKTSTKDAIYDALKERSRYVRKNEKSLNSDIGLPLTIIGAPTAWRSISGWLKNIRLGFTVMFSKGDYPDCLILEVGADHPGDIKSVVEWLHPDIAVIAKVSDTPVHVEFFTSPEQVFEEKSLLAYGVKKGGTVVLYADDPKMAVIAERVKAKGETVITYGLSESADVRGTGYTVTYAHGAPTGFSFTVNMGDASKPVSIAGILGETYQYPLLAAAAVAKAKGVDANTIAESLHEYDAPKGRMNVIPGIHGSTIIDDTYNSSPDAASAALSTLRSLGTGGAKIVILGDMMELGKYAAEEHRKIGREAAKVASILITVGPRSHMTADEAKKSGMKDSDVHTFHSAEDAATFAVNFPKSGDIILVKGSQSVRMERVVKALMADPSQAADLLVRQEPEWLEKK